MRSFFKSARDWIRTSTPFPAPPPQGGASTNFATRAFGWDCKCKRLFSQYNSKRGSFSRFRMFYKQLAIMVLFNNTLA